MIHEFLLHTVWFFASISLPISTFTEEVYLSPRSNSWARLVPHLTNHVLTATTVSVVSANNIETRKMNAITERKNNRFAPKYHRSSPLSLINGKESSKTSLSRPSKFTPTVSPMHSSSSQRLLLINQEENFLIFAGLNLDAVLASGNLHLKNHTCEIIHPRLREKF